MGRPTNCTPELIEQVAAKVREIGFPVTAARRCGITKSVHRDWMRRGEAGDEPYSAYYEAIEFALGERHEENARKVQEGKPGWQGPAWVNERSDPEQFSTKQQIDFVGVVDMGGGAAIATPEERDARLRAMGITPPGQSDGR